MSDITAEKPSLFYKSKHKPVDTPKALAPLADTHTHLLSLDEQSPAKAIARAQVAGVGLIVVPVDSVEDTVDVPAFFDAFASWPAEAAVEFSKLEAQGIDLSQAADAVDLCYIAGVHPYGAAKFDDAACERMVSLLQGKGCRGAGEFGLDYNADVDHALQKEVFRKQLALAREFDMVCELHLRDVRGDTNYAVYRDALEILRRDGFSQKGCIVHCFTQGPDVMQPFVEMGCHIAFGGASTFKNSDDIRRAAAACPEHLLLTETDAPYMAPVPLRGQEAEPAMVSFVCQNIAEVRAEALGVSKQSVYEALWRNASRIFDRHTV